ncbi:uncharacterized protein H6S33_007372, partial [Morchella sextelata]|uniref:uncharacterized protein n=1 Tax=Morchella sextelata TaxID=1174677 RepID=UPI001D0389CD
TTYRSEKLPDPEVFRGDRDRERLHLFKQQMRIKLLGNADRYPTLQSKLSYAFSRLEGVAANQFLQYVGEGGITLPSMLRFYEVLDTAFGDPDRMRTARRNLRNIRQRNRTFADYFAEFQRVRDAYQTTRVHYAELRVRLTATKVEVSKVSSVNVEYESP